MRTSRPAVKLAASLELMLSPMFLVGRSMHGKTAAIRELKICRSFRMKRPSTL